MIDEFVNAVSQGLSGNPDAAVKRTEAAINSIFGQRYWQSSSYDKRIALMSAERNVPFAGILHPENPTSGVYGGMSLIWFPIPEDGAGPACSLLTFVCGTRGLAPDEAILGRPGHARHLRALARFLDRDFNISAWVKRDPTNLSQEMPTVVRNQFARFAHVMARYGTYIYAAVAVPTDVAVAKPVVAAFLDLYAWERGWQPLKAATGEINDLKNTLRRHLFPRTEKSEVVRLLRERRFVVLQGPPGTGKTRMADEIMTQDFAGHGRTVQFHPAVTYESFVAGISPDVDEQSLRFRVRSGSLAAAVKEAQTRDFLLVVDEINRGDLGRVLGEAIYLFEAKEIAEGTARSVHLPQALEDGTSTLSIPQGLYLLGTMNSADRSIAILDLAVRRRFAFVDVWPDLEIVRSQGIDLATEAFGKLQDIFAQFAPDDALVLMPGHAYFLASNEQQFNRRMRYELIPLLEEYLVEGRLGSCEIELEAYNDWLQGEVGRDGQA